MNKMGLCAVIVLTAAMLASTGSSLVSNDKVTVTSNQENKTVTGWIEEDGKRYFIKKDGTKQKGWFEYEGNTYFMNSRTGAMTTGLKKFMSDKWYYFSETGEMYRDCVIDNYDINKVGMVDRVYHTEADVAAKHEELQLKIDEISKKQGAVGLTVAIIEDGEVADTWEYGYAVRDKVEMIEDTKIRVASISKVVLGMNALKMVEKGIVDLDASIGDYWGFEVVNPYYPDQTISLRSIFTHTSSIADIDYGDEATKLQNNSFFRRVKPLAPSSYSYCNYAIGIAGITMEKAADKNIFDICNENFFDALGIDASYAGGRLKNTDLIAELYYSGGYASRTQKQSMNIMGSDVPGSNATFMAGGLYISSKDLAKLFAILANDGFYKGIRYLSKQSVATMEAHYCPAILHGATVTQCLPLKYKDNIYGEEELYFHTGSAYGVYSLASYNPNTKNGVVVVSVGASGACDEYGIYKVCGEISELLYGEMREGITITKVLK